jgi:RNA polymerase sigma-32 factor
MIDAACKKYPILSASNQIALMRAWKTNGDKLSLDQLILSNMRLVISETYKISKYNQNLSYDDLFQEGLAGLLKAAEKFDLSKDTNFTTYAMWWIKAYQKRYTMDNRSVVRLGTTRDGRVMFANLAKAKAKAEALGLEGYEKTRKIAEILKIDVSSVENMIQVLSGYDKSLDTPIGEEKESYVIDTIADDNCFFETDCDNYDDKISLAIAALPEDEQYIIKNRFMAKEPMTLRDVGKTLKISREWVRKLEIRALDRMRKFLSREYNIREF